MARTPIHPGEILEDELDELGIGAAELARQQIGSAIDRLPTRPITVAVEAS